MIAQSAMNVLDPVYRVGSQIVEVIRWHENIPKRSAWNRAASLCSMVGLDRDLWKLILIN